MKKFITGNTAVAEAVRLCRPDVIAAYPITPQTPIYEKLSDWEDSGQMGGKMMRVESEHSAMAACLSASLTGVRTFTATSSQGLALMHEMLHFASGLRTGVVMAAVNRTLASPWAFWSDQTDTLSQRDTGWMQVYCEDNQESADMIIQAFKIAEEVKIPMMVVLEANFISHFMEPVDLPTPEEVDAFLPPVSLPQRFDVDNPGYVSPTVTQKEYEGYRKLTSDAMAYALGVIERVDKEFEQAFGRSYGLVESVNTEDADPAVIEVFEEALLDLEQAGAEIADDFAITDFDTHIEADNWCNRFRYDMAQYLASLGNSSPITDVLQVLESGEYSPYIKDRLERWSANPADVHPGDMDPPCPDYSQHEGRQAFLAEVIKSMDAAGVDAIVYPSWTNPPAHLDNAVEEYLGDNSQLIAPATGMPAVTVPMGYSHGNLPAGLQILGRPYSEGLLIGLAYAYEQATMHRRPPVGFPELESE